MRIFVAGATGALGSPLVRRLVAAGHQVTGTTRSGERAESVRAAGAEAAVCDALDPAAVSAAVRAAEPEVVVHELTAIPAALSPRRVDRQFALTNRLRTEGTRHLIDAARAAGARRFVAQSISFAYDPVGDRVKDESAPLVQDPPKTFRESAGALVELERLTLGADGLDGIVLRYGQIYGPGTGYASDGAIAEQVRARRFPIVGDGGGTFSFIHVDDAAEATLAAIERGAPGAYNVVDDEPAPAREWIPHYAQVIGAPPPRRVPTVIARLVAGSYGVLFMTEMRGASNAKIKRELGWQPARSTWREGFAELRS
jgi:nucleoside-diphosphate-sugar epimerase